MAHCHKKYYAKTKKINPHLKHNLKSTKHETTHHHTRCSCSNVALLLRINLRQGNCFEIKRET